MKYRQTKADNKQPYFNYQPIHRQLQSLEESRHNYQSFIKDSFQFSSSRMHGHQQPQSSRAYVANTEQQVQFLKDKLIETHNKLLKQLQSSQELEQVVDQQKRINDQLREDIEGFRAEIAMYRKLEEQARHITHQQADKFRVIQLKYTDTENKAQVLRSDLQVMRNKMLQVILQKNQIQQSYQSFRQNNSKQKQKFDNLHAEVKQKNNEIQYLNNQIQVLRSKCSHANQQIQNLEQENHKVKSLINTKNTNQAQLDHHYKLQKDKSMKLLQQVMSIQAEHKDLLRRTNQLEQQNSRLKDEIYWLQNSKEEGNKVLNNQLQKLTQQLNSMNSLYKQKQKQIQKMKKKPIEEAEKRRVHYENTKQFVRNLESEQSHLVTHKITSRVNPITHVQNRTTRKQYTNSSASRDHNSKPKSTLSKSPLSYAEMSVKKNSGLNNTNNVTNANNMANMHSENSQKYISMLSQVNELQNALLNCNIERKKVMTQIDRIDDTKVKTKDIIGKRRRLEEQLSYQDGKIKKIKQQLRKMKVI